MSTMDPFERVEIGSTGVWVIRLGVGGGAVPMAGALLLKPSRIAR